MRHNIRRLLLATLTLGSAACAMIGSASPAAAYDYPYCLQSRETGIPGDCSYRSYRECQVTASGRGAYCNINPAFAYRQQPLPPHGRRYHPVYYND